MRIAAILMILGIMQAHATEAYSQKTRLSLNFSNVELVSVLDKIEDESEFYFLYNEKLLDTDRKVDINVNDQLINVVLDDLFTGTDIKYTIIDRKIILAPDYLTDITTPQQNRITGTVTDKKGPIPGANVVVTGTTLGAITNSDGKFSIEVPPGSKSLTFSFIGFESQEINIDSKTQIDVTMIESSIGLEEVVVTGYGTQKKASITGSISRVNYGQAIKNRPITDVSQSLSGMMSGVYVSQNSGKPGFDGATIRIRGYGTLNNSNPLILIDGIEGKLSDLNPNDVASVTVFKDATSAAIYGSRAANGVVLVETKKGEGGKVTLSYDSYVGIQQLGRHYETINNSAEYMGMWNQAITNSGGSPLFPNDVINAFKNGTDPYKYPNTNWFDEVFRNSIITSHNLSASLASENSKTFMSAGYSQNDGIIKNTDSKRFSVALNNETKVNQWLKFGIRTRLIHTLSSEPYDGINRVIYMMANGRPLESPYLQDGKTFGGTQALYISGPNAGLPIVDSRNPFPDLYNGETLYSNNFMKGNIYGTIDFSKDLSLTMQYNSQYSNSNSDRYNQANWCYTDLDGSNKTKPLDYPSTLYVSRGIADEYYNTYFANLNYNHTFAGKHEITGLLGAQSEDLTKRVTTAQRSDPPKENLHEVSAGTSNPTNSGNKYLSRMISYFGRVNYVFMGKYLAEVNLRADASSRFAKGNRWGYFPSVSAGWRLGEESFIKNLGVFNSLKLRASWGKLGNQNIGSSSNRDYFPYLTVLEQSYGTSYNFGGQLAPGVAVTSLVDPGITWETTTTSDIGLDMGFLKNRLFVEADYFQKITSDIIVQMPISAVLGGVTPPYQNKGEMNNTGFEISVNWRDQIPTSDISYGIGANFTFTTNEVTKFEAASPDQLYLIRQGYSYKTLYGYVFQGIYQSDTEASEHLYANSYKPKAGDIKYKDVNNDGQIGYQDFQDIGNTIPKFNYGINGNVSWKNFDLNFLFSGVAGVTVYNGNTWTIPLGVSGACITERWRNAWTEENQSKDLFALKVNDTWNTQNSSFWSCNLAWLKLKNLQLGYTIPAKLTNKIKIDRLYVYLNGSDVFTLTSKGYEGYDPERDTFATGYDTYPSARIYTLGLNVSF